MRNEKFDWFQKNCVGTANQHSIFLYLHLKKLAPGGIWTHTVRVGEGYNHIMRISP